MVTAAYLLFNEGYTAMAGTELIRRSLCDEAIRLTRALTTLMPDEPEASALLALMLFHHSRRHTRIDSQGELVTLEDQDRSAWDQREIGEGVESLDNARRRGPAGPYLVQAEIAACHATAGSASATDWSRIASAYLLLGRLVPSKVVELNRAVAVGMADGPAAGLVIVDELASARDLDAYYLLHATRADLLRRLGRDGEAAVSYRQALNLADNDAERRYLARRLADASGQR